MPVAHLRQPPRWRAAGRRRRPHARREKDGQGGGDGIGGDEPDGAHGATHEFLGDETISPYITSKTRRFGDWTLDLTRPPPVTGRLDLPEPEPVVQAG